MTREPKVHWWNPYDEKLSTDHGSFYGCGVKLRMTGQECTRAVGNVTCPGCLKYLLEKKFPGKPKTEIKVQPMLFDAVLTDEAIGARSEQIRRAMQEAADEDFVFQGAVALEDSEVHLVFARKLRI